MQNAVYSEIRLRVYHTPHIIKTLLTCSQSQWPGGLMRGSAVALLLNCMFEFCWGHGCLSLVARCVLSEVSASGRSLVQRSHTRCGVYLGVIVNPR